MPALVIALGNPLRHDDGVAHRVLELLNPRPDVERRSLMQLTPEVAEEIADRSTVIFVDADASGTDLRIEPLETSPAGSSFSHVANPSEIVTLARHLYHFTGDAFLCRIPVPDFSPGEGLSEPAQVQARSAARQIEQLL